MINTKKIDKYLQSVNSVKVTEAFLPTIFFFGSYPRSLFPYTLPVRRALFCHATPVITVKQKELIITSQVRRIRINPDLALQALWKLNRKFSCETLRHYERCKSFEMHIISKLTAKDSMRYNCNEFCCSRHSRQFLDNKLGKHVWISWRHKVN